MTDESDISDEQWAVLSLMIDQDWQPFMALLKNSNIPQALLLRLGFALKLLTENVVEWSPDGSKCRITPYGEQLYEERFGHRKGVTFNDLEAAKQMAIRH